MRGKKEIALWVGALRSCEYHQLRYKLYDGFHHFSALGVGCEVHRKQTGQGYWHKRKGLFSLNKFGSWEYVSLYLSGGKSKCCVLKMMESYYGLNEVEVKLLGFMNDRLGYKFWRVGRELESYMDTGCFSYRFYIDCQESGDMVYRNLNLRQVLKF